MLEAEVITYVNQYRKNNPRCRTCEFARDKLDYEHWLCIAKNQLYYGSVDKTFIKGIFCPLYRPKKYESEVRAII